MCNDCILPSLLILFFSNLITSIVLINLRLQNAYKNLDNSKVKMGKKAKKKIPQSL